MTQDTPTGGQLAAWLARLAPLAIIGGLLYAAFFVQVVPDLPEVVQPAVGARDRFYGITSTDGQLWAVGALGKVVTSRDGRQWSRQTTPITAHLQSIAAWDARRLVAVGNGGSVIVTEDGGGHWASVDTPAADGRKFLRVRTFAGGVAWATGEFGMVLRSEDFGASWREAMPAEDIGWNDVAVRGEQVLVVGEFGRIARSVDGGRSWGEVEAGVESSLTSVWMGEGLALAVGLDGHILRSTDQGQGWQRVRSGTREHLFSVAPAPEGFVAVGNRGVVLTGDRSGGLWHAGRAGASDFAWRTALTEFDDRWMAAGQRLGPIELPGT